MTTWYLSADELAEIDEEYRRYNRKFRKLVLDTLAKEPNHPLRFLITSKKRFSKKSLFDAGHVRPVKKLAKEGTRRERLLVEERGTNRRNGAKPIGCVVNLGGIPVSKESLRVWSATHKHLKNYLHLPCVKGGGHVGKEIGYVLELPGTLWLGRN